jgi:putative tricarboxylic transport membrane protein
MGPSASARLKASVAPTVFLLVALGVCLEAMQVPLGSFRMPGAGFFPLALGLALALCSTLLLAMSLARPAFGSTEGWPEQRAVFYLTACVIVAVWLFERAGFLLTMTLFLTATTRILGGLGWLTAVVVAVIGSTAAYVVFGRLLVIALPSGILPF